MPIFSSLKISTTYGYNSLTTIQTKHKLAQEKCVYTTIFIVFALNVFAKFKTFASAQKILAFLNKTIPLGLSIVSSVFFKQ